MELSNGLVSETTHMNGGGFCYKGEEIILILPLSRTYVIKTQHNNNAMLIPNLTR